MVHRTVNIAILSCQFTSTVSSLPMLWRTHVVARCPGGPIWSLGHDFAPQITNISFFRCRAELRSRYHWPAWTFLGWKVASASMHPCIHVSMHPCIHAPMHTIVYASSYVYSGLVCCMLWVAGGKCGIQLSLTPLVTLP